MDYLSTISEDQGNSQALIVRNGYLIWSGTDIDNAHNVWSVSKSFTSTVLGLLIDDGDITVDSLAKDYVESLSTDYSTVTLRHFATHTSGYNAVGGDQSSTPFDPSTPLFAPGTEFQYWDSAMNQFANVLTQIAGLPIEDLFCSRIADPIGMDPTKWSWGDWGTIGGIMVNGGAGNKGKGINISASELARFGLLFLNRGNWNGEQLISADWVDQATSVQVSPSLPSHIEGQWGPGLYGFNWWINGTLPSGERSLPNLPPSSYYAAGYNGNYLVVIPEWNLLFVRLGTDGTEYSTSSGFNTFCELLAQSISVSTSPDPGADSFTYTAHDWKSDSNVATVTLNVDTDPDNDSITVDDNCPVDYNPDQADADNDGTGDECDTCPFDYENDADGDGVCGDVDICPNDPAKVEPGICGCGNPDTDTDNDGSADCIDECPNDSDKVEAGICGCGVGDTDTDSDGTPDCNDNCPTGYNPSQTDEDNDGIGDACDNCPNDPAKVEPGICGCGTPDTDTDSDGTADCIDECDSDSAKTTPGICGCGNPDTDTDNDGSADCIDECPNDSDKVEAGICGCGVADTDTDSDGTPDCNDNCPDDPDDACVNGIDLFEFGYANVSDVCVTVDLKNTYNSPVVVCSVQYNNNTAPVIARVSEVTSDSFKVRLQNPSGDPVMSERVNYLVVEEGVWSIDGINFEAHTYLSTVTDQDSNWIGEAQSYGQSYSNPVVLGQVMSENDTAWSAFWCQGDSRTNPPSAAALTTGKMVGEDPDVMRADEIIGLIVFEAGHGTIGGIEFEAGLGTDTIEGVDNGPPFSYSYDTAFTLTPNVVITTLAGMDGPNGGWAQPHGALPATTTELDLSVDEDQVGDSERSHINEQVGYIVFGQVVDNEPPSAADDNNNVDEDGEVTIDVLANDEDVDGHTLTISDITQPSRGTAQINTDGTITYMPEPNYCGTDTFTYTVDDGYGGTGTASVTVDINCVNDPPFISGDPATTVYQGDIYQFFPVAGDVDDDILVFTIENQPGWTVFDQETGELSGIPGENETGTTDGIVISVTDGSEYSSALAPFSIEILEPSDQRFHVSDIEVASQSWWRLTNGSARVRITDSQGLPVSNALVTGQWSGGAGDTDQFTTGSDGWGTAVSDRRWGNTSFTFCVTNVVLDEWVYDPDDNVTTCASN